MLVGVFGKVPFLTSSLYILTPTGIRRELSTKWAQHDVLGSRPVLEWTGETLAKMSFKMRFDSSRGMPPMAGHALLKGYMEDHLAQPLVIGADYFGRFVIESLSENHLHHTGAGICMISEVDISLIEFQKGWS